MMNTRTEKLTVLVVDDYYVICTLLKNFLSEYQFDVITCSNGVEGIKKAYQVKPDLIFLDLLMPDLDGIKMLHVIRSIEQLKTIPVIVVSANTNRTNVLSAIEAGADRVLSKPLRKEIILKNVKELLGIEILKADENEVKNIDDYEMIKELRHDFLTFFNSRRNEFVAALDKRSSDSLKRIIHDLKGTGSAIGYPQLTSISAEIQDDLLAREPDWNFIKLKCGKILSIVSEIENGNRPNG